ncbi:MAG: ATPase [Pseudomonadota bacterium]
MNIAADIDDQPQMRVIPAPEAPRTVEDTGLEEGFLVDLLCKTIYRQGLERPTQMSAMMRLPVPVIERLLDAAKEAKLVETLGQLGASMRAEMRYSLSGKGREWALSALKQSEYVGPAPVTMDAFAVQTTKQTIRTERLSEQTLRRVFGDLVLPDQLYDSLGPAINSFSAILLYGPPGNGKSSISNAVTVAFQDHIFIPHAVIVERQVIVLFDPTVHEPLEVKVGEFEGAGIRRDRPFDQRYVACTRPSITTGGELSLDMLDLSFNPTARTYEAPLQLKATGGVLVVDDFGRQRETPQQLMNRLIVPLEEGVDFLALQSGRKFQVPFDALVVFSTNIPPKKLVDDAALRRLRYKILIDSPDQETFLKILVTTAGRFGMEVDEETVAFMLFELYGKDNVKFQAFHPRFFCDQARALAQYKGTKPELTDLSLRRAWGNLFTTE